MSSVPPRWRPDGFPATRDSQFVQRPAHFTVTIPPKAKLLTRWRCPHVWGPVGMVDYACLRCGSETDGFPKDGRWRVRAWIAEQIVWRLGWR